MSNLTDAMGANAVSYRYDLYGTASASAETANPHNFRGEYTDYLTGNQYLRARYYRADSGCGWLSNLGSKLVSTVKTVVTNVVNTIKQVVNVAAKAAPVMARQAVQTVGAAKQATKAVASLAGKALVQGASFVSYAGEQVYRNVSHLVEVGGQLVSKFEKKMCTTAKRLMNATVEFVKDVDWKKVAVGAAIVVGLGLASVLTGGAASAIGSATSASASGIINHPLTRSVAENIVDTAVGAANDMSHGWLSNLGQKVVCAVKTVAKVVTTAVSVISKPRHRCQSDKFSRLR